MPHAVDVMGCGVCRAHVARDMCDQLSRVQKCGERPAHALGRDRKTKWARSRGGRDPTVQPLGAARTRLAPRARPLRTHNGYTLCIVTTPLLTSVMYAHCAPASAPRESHSVSARPDWDSYA